MTSTTKISTAAAMGALALVAATGCQSASTTTATCPVTTTIGDQTVSLTMPESLYNAAGGADGEAALKDQGCQQVTIWAEGYLAASWDQGYTDVPSPTADLPTAGAKLNRTDDLVILTWKIDRDHEWPAEPGHG